MSYFALSSLEERGSPYCVEVFGGLAGYSVSQDVVKGPRQGFDGVLVSDKRLEVLVGPSVHVSP